MKWKMGIAYQGTRYGGWQIQKNTRAIQEEIENSLDILLKKKTPIVGSGRTDAGVHAREQVAHFTTEETLDLYRFQYAMNALLPKDIRILWMEEALEDFHARFSAKKKIYHYHLHLHPVINPFQREYAYHLPYPISKALIRDAASYFLGTHDFTAFSNQADRGSCSRDPVRTLYRLDVVEEPEGIRLEFEGDGFLYKMVRTIVGTLLEVGKGKLKVDQIPVIFESRNRSLAGNAAPPHGLFLVKVFY